MARPLIASIEYFPPISTIALAYRGGSITIESHENYQKKSTRNRARILGPNGVETLSVPLAKGKNSKQQIMDVRISYDTNWTAKHLHSIRSAYGNAPYFEHYYPLIQDIYQESHTYLYNMNRAIMQMVFASFKLPTSISDTERFHVEYPDTTVDIRNVATRTIHLESLDLQPYYQVFEDKFDFVPDLSSLDLLMCMGPEGIFYL